MKFNIKATATGTSINEIASKVTLGAYTADLDLTGLEVTADGINSDDTESFSFPHVKTFINHLNGNGEV